MSIPTRIATAAAGTLALAALSAPVPASAQQEMEEPITVELSPVGESGVSGTAVIHTMAPGRHGEMMDEGEHGEMMEEGEHGEMMRDESMHDHEVEVTLQGLEAGETYPVHVHRGTCAEGGDVFHPLAGVTAGDGGEGTSTTTVTAAEMSEKMAEMEMGMEGDQGMEEHPSFFVMAHLPDGTPAACGDVPMKEGQGEM